jgi:hypothetical protein
MIEEIWKDVEGYDGRYFVSNLGNVKNARGKLMGQYINKNGYFTLHLSKSGVKKFFAVHRLVIITFVPNAHNKEDCNHINGIKTDNRLSNLEWATKSENSLHAFKLGLRQPNAKFGVNHPKSKLKESDISYIRENYIKYKIPMRELALKFNVHRTTIKSVIHNKSYSAAHAE